MNASVEEAGSYAFQKCFGKVPEEMSMSVTKVSVCCQTYVIRTRNLETSSKREKLWFYQTFWTITKWTRNLLIVI